MILFNTAFETVMKHVKPIKETETVRLQDSTGRILAEDVRSDRDIPPFNRVAMDGYACRREDAGNELDIIGVVQAGQQPPKTIGRNQCVKVMTGCPLPDGADLVFMVEHAEELPNNRVRCTCNKKDLYFRNFASKGEDLKSGDMILKKGTLISPRHIGVLASVGCTKPRVVRRPEVGIIATGDEIVEPWEQPQEFQIRNANSYQLMTQIYHSGAVPVYFGIAPDDHKAIDSTIKKATSGCDFFLLTGGVSMGDFDLVPAVLKENGFDILFNRVAVKPGKPTTFAVSQTSACFGLPGNPVSTFVIFEIMVKSFLYKMMGHDFNFPPMYLPLGQTISRKKAEREEWFPVTVTSDGKVEPVLYHGSGHFEALTHTDGLIKIEKGVFKLQEGTAVYVRQI